MKELRLPDPSYSSMCRNSMNEICLEECVLKGEGEHFKLDPRMTLDRAPNVNTDHLKPRLQFKIEKAKTELIINHLLGKGVIYETIDFIRGGKGAEHVYSSRLPKRPLSHSDGHQGNTEGVPLDSISTDSSNELREDR